MNGVNPQAEFIVRPTRPEELDAVLQILAEGREALGALGIDQWQDGYPEPAVVRNDIERHISYVVAESGEERPGHASDLLATAAIDFAGEPTYDVIDGAWLTASSSTDPSYGVIHRIATAAQARRRGISRFLLNQAENLARARGALSLRIDTHPGNGPMQRMVTSCGYTLCGVIQIDLTREATKDRLAYEKLL